MKNNEYPKMHVSLYVSDIKETVQFYNRFFNQDATKIKSNYAKYMLENPALTISFVENPERVNKNFGHLGFQVESVQEVKDKHASIKSFGMQTLEEENVACCYAVQDKFWVQDPDGYRWEVYYFHADSEFNDPVYDNEEASQCCNPEDKKDLREHPKEHACC